MGVAKAHRSVGQRRRLLALIEMSTVASVPLAILGVPVRGRVFGLGNSRGKRVLQTVPRLLINTVPAHDLSRFFGCAGIPNSWFRCTALSGFKWF